MSETPPVISEKSRRIARNTVFLYVRMLVLMLVGLFTSRVVLHNLGQVDFGLYGAVAGVVTLCTVLTESMAGAISRFVAFELGSGRGQSRKVFQTALCVQLVLSLAVVLLCETAGLWWIDHKMVIPPERMGAAHGVFQFSVLTLVIQLMSVPYHAEILAHERMDAYALISIFEGLGKLAVAFLLLRAPIDRLVWYAALLALVSLLTRIIYSLFCRRNFPHTRSGFLFDRKVFGEMFSFAGWNFIGSGAGILRSQGGNQLLNLFFGPVINAAWLLTTQVNTAVGKFVTSFISAINPQITKSYASGEREYMLRLVFTGSRLSVYLLLPVVCTVFFNAPFLVELWLGRGAVPPDTVLFIRLMLVNLLIESVSYTLVTAMLSTGNIRNYQLLVGGLQLLNIPVDYLFLRAGAPAAVIFYVAIVISVLCLFARVYMLRGMIGLPALRFVKEVLWNELRVCVPAFALPWLLVRCLSPDTWPGFLSNCGVCLLVSLLCIAFLGLSRKERNRRLFQIFTR